MLKMVPVEQKPFNWPVNKRDMALQKIPHIFPIEYNICTYNLSAVATVHFL